MQTFVDKGRIKVPTKGIGQMSASYTQGRDFKIKKNEEKKNKLEESNQDYMGASFLNGESVLVPTMEDNDLLSGLNNLESRNSTDNQ